MTAYSVFYLICLILSCFCTVLFVIRYTRQVPIQFPLIFLILPIVQMGYLMFSMSSNLEEALLATKIIYLGGCFIQTFVLFSILHIYRIHLRKTFQTTLYAIAVIMYGFVLTIGFNSSFYKSAEFEITADGARLLHKEYGMVHSLFYVQLVVYMFAGIILLVYARLSQRKNVSTRTVALFVIVEVFDLIAFFFGRMITNKVEVISASYVFTQIFFLAIMSYASLYSIADNSALLYEGNTTTDGFISFDSKKRYIGANAAALKIYPALAQIPVDTSLDTELNEDFKTFANWMDLLDTSSNPMEYDVMVQERYYKVTVNFLRNERNKNIGYFISLDDVTQTRKYTHLLEEYSHKLNDEVNYTTAHIKEIQDQLILRFADMIENRDSLTGGHIKHTCHALNCIVSRIASEQKESDRAFYSNIVSSAPLHDIGKIAIPDTILQKPGRFEKWEFEIMKNHAEKGAEIIRNAFTDYDDSDFKRIAENLAHYHHERWDGDGYPEGLSGTDIPLEARIMAIADVYDALVTKRCYKERSSFEEAYKIIMDGMGTQFDPSLAKYFSESRRDLESYYSQIRSEEDA